MICRSYFLLAHGILPRWLGNVFILSEVVTIFLITLTMFFILTRRTKHFRAFIFATIPQCFRVAPPTVQFVPTAGIFTFLVVDIDETMANFLQQSTME